MPASTQPGHLSLIYASVLLTPLRTPSRTARQTVLKNDGTSLVTPFTNAPWTLSAKRRKRTQIGLKQELLHLNQQSQLSGWHCSTTRERESLQQRHLLHSGRPETTPSGLLDNVPMTTGHTSRTAFNFFLSLATPAPCTRA